MPCAAKPRGRCGAGAVVHYEDGKTDPDRGVVEKIAGALGVNAGWLAYGTGSRTRTYNLLLYVTFAETDERFRWRVRRRDKSGAALLDSTGRRRYGARIGVTT